MFGKSHALRYPVKVVSVLSGTGTEEAKGIFTVVASSGAADTVQRVYLTVTSATNIGTLVGTYSATL